MLLAFTGANIQPRQNESKNATRLKLVLSSSKQRVVQNESFTLEVVLKNISDKRVSIFGELLWGYRGGLTLHVSDAAGHKVEPKQYDDDSVIPSVLNNAESYITLLPDHFLGIRRKDPQKPLSQTWFIFLVRGVSESCAGAV